MFKLTIRTTFETIFEGQVESLSLSSEGGDMQIFENHASITATIAFSPIIIVEAGKEEQFLARNGVLLFDNDKNEASILVAYCEKKGQINYKAVEDYADFVTKQLEEGHSASEFQIKFLKGEKVAAEQQIIELKGKL